MPGGHFSAETDAYGDKITGKDRLRHAVQGFRPGVRRLRGAAERGTAAGHADTARFRSRPVVRRIRRCADRGFHTERHRQFQRRADGLRHGNRDPQGVPGHGTGHGDFQTLDAAPTAGISRVYIFSSSFWSRYTLSTESFGAIKSRWSVPCSL